MACVDTPNVDTVEELKKRVKRVTGFQENEICRRPEGGCLCIPPSQEVQRIWNTWRRIASEKDDKDVQAKWMDRLAADFIHSYEKGNTHCALWKISTQEHIIISTIPESDSVRISKYEGDPGSRVVTRDSALVLCPHFKSEK